MSTNKSSGDTTVTLAGVDLPLAFKSRNMMKLSELTGASPIAIFTRFEGVDMNDVQEAAAKLCDYNMVVNLMVAGLAHHKEYKRTSDDNLIDKVCRLIDAEADRNKKPSFQVVAELAAQILPAILSSMNVVVPGDEVATEGNPTKPPAAGEEAQGDSSGET